MAPWILIEMMAEQRQLEAERAATRGAARLAAAAPAASSGGVRTWLARALLAAALCLDRGVAGGGAARTAGRTA